MTYTPLSINQQARTNTQLSATAVSGLNLEGLPEMMKLEFAKKIVNYIPYTYGAGLRKGIEEEAEKAGLTTGFTLFKYFRDGKFIVGYDTTIAYYDIATGTFTDIKTDFTAGGSWGGGRYGEFFFVTNNIEKPYRLDSAYAETELVNAPICKDRNNFV